MKYDLILNFYIPKTILSQLSQDHEPSENVEQRVIDWVAQNVKLFETKKDILRRYIALEDEI